MARGTVVVAARVPGETKSLVQLAARRADLTVSEWAGAVLRAAALDDLRKPAAAASQPASSEAT